MGGNIVKKFTEWLEKYLTPVAAKLQQNKYLGAISKGLMMTMPILIIGSLGSIFLNLQINSYQVFIEQSGLNVVLNSIVDLTTNLLAIYAVFTIAYTFAKSEGINNAIPAGIISLLCFLVVTPLSAFEINERMTTVLPFSWLGPKGLFTAMIVALITAKIYSVFIKKDIVIKMPESVPPFVANSFTGIIPGIVAVFIFAVVSFSFGKTEYGTLHQLVYSLIQYPLSGLGTTLSAVIIIYILEGLCWFCGVHAIAVASVVMPIWMAAGAENLAGTASNIVTWGWVNAFAGVGGAGATLGLVLLFIWLGKSAKNKAIGKLGIVPSLFNINEPVVFGVPCVLNAYLVIPFVLAPVICLIIAYALTVVGFMPINNGISVPGGTPLVLSGFLICGWQGALVQLLFFPICMLIYYPFFKIYDKKCYEEELAYEKEQKNSLNGQ